MTRSIYLATDLACWRKDRIEAEKLGGAELFFVRLRRQLLQADYQVFDPVLSPTSKEVDLVIHSNYFYREIRAKKHLVWGGSWTVFDNEPEVEKVILISEYMKQRRRCERAIVIPAPYDKRILVHKKSPFAKPLGRIVSTSNPNRWFEHAGLMTARMAQNNLQAEWHFCGGNRLYGQKFMEHFDFDRWKITNNVKMVYHGLLERHDLFELLSTASVWVYPCFSNPDETFCLAMIEAAALKIPVVLPRLEPFISVLPDALFVDSWEEMVDKIEDVLANGPHERKYQIEQYSEAVVFSQLLKKIEEMLQPTYKGPL